MNVLRSICRHARLGLLLLPLALGWAFLTACTPMEHRKASITSNTASPSSSTNQPRIFQVKGVIKKLEVAKKQVVIAHEEVPGYMPKMTMPFDVRGSMDWNAFKPGDSVVFRMTVTEDDGWIDQLRKDTSATSTAVPSTTNASAAIPPASALSQEPLFPGDPMPGYNFTNQLGQPMTFAQYHGQATAFTFIFTTCPFPTMCPRMSNNLRDAYRLLKAAPGGATNWHLFSITIDPAVDSPSVLKSYADRYNYDPSHWSFLTGDLETIETLGRQFGLNFFRDNGSLNHNLRTVVVGRDGKVRKILVGNEWKPEELVEELQGALK